MGNNALSISSQLFHCPMMLSMDTYQGCGSKCRYCFASEIYDKQNRATARKTHVIPLNINKWEKVLKGEKIGNPMIEHLVSKGHPIQLGTKSDPFPYGLEKKFGVTQKFLEWCNEYQYPVYITTKNTDNLPIDLLSKGNYILAVSLSSHRPADIRMLEINTLDPIQRVNCIPKGVFKKIVIRWQPFIPQLFPPKKGSSDLLDWNEIDKFLDLIEGRADAISMSFMNWDCVKDDTLMPQCGPLDYGELEEIEMLEYIKRGAHERGIEFYTAHYRALSDSDVCCGIKKDEFETFTPWVWGRLISKLFNGEKEYLTKRNLEENFPKELKDEVYNTLNIAPYSRWQRYKAKKTSILDIYKENFTYNRKMNPANLFAGLYSRVVDGEFRIYFQEYRDEDFLKLKDSKWDQKTKVNSTQ